MSVTVAAIQMNSLDNLQTNLKQAEVLLEQAANAGAKLAVLPENFAVFAAGMQIHTATANATYSSMVSRAIAKT